MPARSKPTPTARTEALKLLRRKAVTAKQLREHLRDKGHDEPSIKSTLAELRSLGFINDRRLAESAALTSVARAEASGHAIQSLHARGVSPPTAKSAVLRTAHDDGRTDLQRAVDFAKARLRGPLAGLTPEVQRRRLFALLARRGHEQDAAETIVNMLIPEAPIDDLPSEQFPEES